MTDDVSLALRLGYGDTDIATIQQAVDQVLARIRACPPFRDPGGRLVLDLAELTGQPPIDLEAVAPGSGLAELDFTRLRVRVGQAGRGMGGVGTELWVGLTLLPVVVGTGVTLAGRWASARRDDAAEARWRQRQEQARAAVEPADAQRAAAEAQPVDADAGRPALLAFWTQVLADAVRRLTSHDAFLGEPRVVAPEAEPPGSPGEPGEPGEPGDGPEEGLMVTMSAGPRHEVEPLEPQSVDR